MAGFKSTRRASDASASAGRRLPEHQRRPRLRAAAPDPGEVPRTLKDVISLTRSAWSSSATPTSPGSALSQKRIDPKALSGAEARLELCLHGHDELTAAGYHHIGMDHFALPEE